MVAGQWRTVLLATAALTGSSLAQSSSRSGSAKPPTSSFTALSTSPTHDRSATVSSSSTSEDVGGFILGGLGQSNSLTLSTTSPSARQSAFVTASTSIRVSDTASRSRLPSTTGLSNATDCQAASVSYSSVTSSILRPYYTNITSTITTQTTTIVTSGVADIYTTSDGFPHAHGNLTATAYQGVVAIVLSATITPNFLLAPSSLVLPRAPNCTIGPSSCSALYSAYSSSLGITGANATLPYISPVPTNSPRCLTNSECTGYQNADGCTVSGSEVKVFYWPPQPTGTGIFLNGTTRARNNTGPRTVVTEGITMTSPSVYLSFNYLSAFTYLDGGQVCATFADGAVGYAQIGSTHTNSWLSLMPSEVSTLEKMTWSGQTTKTFPDAAITAMRDPNATDYVYWASAVSAAGYGWQPSRLDFNKLTRPDARAYYLKPFLHTDNPYYNITYPVGQQPEYYAKGCFPYGRHPGCNTIFDDLYRAQISLPSEVRNIDPAWSTCGPIFYGVHDPPIALTAADDPVTPNAPTTTPSSSTTTSADPGSPIATPTVPATVLSALVTTSVTVKPIPSSARIEVSVTALDTPTRAAGGDQQTTSAQNSIANPPAQSTQAQNGAQTVTFASPVANTPQSAANAAQALTQPANPAPSQGSDPTAVITAGGSTLTATSSGGNVVVGSATLSSGGATVINGATVSNDGSAIVVQPADPTAQAQPAASTTVGSAGGQAVVAQAGSTAVVIGGTATLTQGQSTNVGGTVVSVGSTAVIIGSTTVALPSSQAVAAATTLATAGTQAIVAQPGSTGVVIGGTATLTQGQVTTVGGTVISVGSTAVVVGSSTVVLPSSLAAAPTTLATAGTQAIVAQPGSTGVIIGGTATLTAGQSTTISGTVISVGSTAITVGSSTIALPTNGPQQTITSVSVLEPSITIAGSTITANSNGAFVVGSTTILPGGSAVTISGTTISVAPSDAYVVVNGKTTTLAKPITQTIVVTVAASRSVKAGASATTAAATAYTGAAASFNAKAPLLALAAGIVALGL